ncbi:hypothetical protein [uncultured Ilyobacter sp.]|uniref:hypothetical protein n=1 Tax=uncultured Ilyobacter sp. TaxID=544433 RepID=UPI0029F4FAE6|nr:hypothetical protein [uncultured Ilyobacter sp.]
MENWEDEVLYFLLVDRFSNGSEIDLYSYADYENILYSEESEKIWEEFGDRWNGGSLNGIKSKTGYLKNMGDTMPILR